MNSEVRKSFISLYLFTLWTLQTLNFKLAKRMEEILKQIISLDKEDRQKLSKSIKTNGNLWNAINGLGTASSRLKHGNIDGIIVKQGSIAEGIHVIAYKHTGAIPVGGTKTKPTYVLPNSTIEDESDSDSDGFYQLDLAVGYHDVYFTENNTVLAVKEKVFVSTDLFKTVNMNL